MSQTLNFDILAAVIPQIELRSDLLSFMYTCSGLYHSGIPVLLGFPTLVDNKNLRQFYAFLMSKAPASLITLRDLTLWVDSTLPALNQDSVQMVTDILSRGRNLQHLRIYGDILHRYPSLCQTLSMLPYLRSLMVPCVFRNAEKLQLMFSQLRSPLVKLDYYGSCEGDLDLQMLLVNFQRSLEELVISQVLLRPTSTRAVVFSKLIHLTLHSVVNTQLSILIPAFPILQTLELSLCDLNDQDTDKVRGENLRWQADHPSQKWQLSSLTADVASLYVLGLRSGVPQVTITSFSPETDSHKLKAALQPLCPLQLCFANKGEDGPVYETDWLPYVITAEPQWKGLNQIELSVDYRPAYHRRITPEEWLDSLFSHLHLVSISQPNLLAIEISLCGEYDQEYPVSALPRIGDFAYSALDGLEMDGLAIRAVRAIPSLRVAKFIIETKNVRESWWARGQETDMVPVSPGDEAAFVKVFDSLMASACDMYHKSGPRGEDDTVATQ